MVPVVFHVIISDMWDEMDPEKYPVFIRFGPAPLGTFDPPEDKHDMKFVRYTEIFKKIIVLYSHSACPPALCTFQWKVKSIEAAFETSVSVYPCTCIHTCTHRGGWVVGMSYNLEQVKIIMVITFHPVWHSFTQFRAFHFHSVWSWSGGVTCCLQF